MDIEIFSKFYSRTFKSDFVHVDLVVVKLSPVEHHELLDKDFPDVVRRVLSDLPEM